MIVKSATGPVDLSRPENVVRGMVFWVDGAPWVATLHDEHFGWGNGGVWCGNPGRDFAFLGCDPAHATRADCERFGLTQGIDARAHGFAQTRDGFAVDMRRWLPLGAILKGETPKGREERIVLPQTPAAERVLAGHERFIGLHAAHARPEHMERLCCGAYQLEHASPDDTFTTGRRCTLAIGDHAEHEDIAAGVKWTAKGAPPAKAAGMAREMAYRGRAEAASLHLERAESVPFEDAAEHYAGAARCLADMRALAREWDGQFVEWRESGNVTPTAVERALAESRADTGFRPVVMAGTPRRKDGLLYGAAQVAAERFGRSNVLTLSMGTIRIGEHDVECQVRRRADGQMDVTFPAHPAARVSPHVDRYEVTIGGEKVTGIVSKGHVDNYASNNPAVRLTLWEWREPRPVAGACLDVIAADEVVPTFAYLRAVYSAPRPSKWAHVDGSFSGVRVLVFVESDTVGRCVRSRLARAGGVVDGAALRWSDGSIVRVVTREAPGMRADVVIGSDRGKPVQWMFSDPWSLGVHVPADKWEAFFGFGQSRQVPPGEPLREVTPGPDPAGERASRLPEWTDGMVRQLHATRKALAGAGAFDATRWMKPGAPEPHHSRNATRPLHLFGAAIAEETVRVAEARMLTKALRAALPDVDRLPWDLVDRKPLHAAAHALCEMAEAATDGGGNGSVLRPMLGEMLGILRAAEHLPPTTARQMAERSLDAARKAWPRGKK